MTTRDTDLVAGRYRLRGEIGRGGMGTVWRAEDTVLHRDVAVKEVQLPPELDDAQRQTRRIRLMREARTAGRLNHPAVVTVYDVVSEDGRPWIVMELVPGQPLDAIVSRRGPLRPVDAAHIGAQLAGALAVAHAAGVLHRDIKPANVLVCDGRRVVLTDFGIATAEGDSSLTQTGVLIGSPAFLAPEQIAGDDPSQAGDMWSLGATLYSVVEGKPPFLRSNPMATLGAILRDPVPYPASAGPLASTIAALLDRDAAARPSAERTAELLGRVAADGLDPLAGPHQDQGQPGDAYRTLPYDTPPPGAGGPGPQGPRGPYGRGPEPYGLPPVPGAATAHEPVGRSGGRRAVAPLVVLAVLAACAGGLVWWRHGNDPGTTGLAGQHRATRHPSGSHAGPTAAGKRSHRPRSPHPTAHRTEPRATLPSGYQAIQDTTGYSLGLPPGWTKDRKSAERVRYFPPGPPGKEYLEIDRTAQQYSDPLRNIHSFRSHALAEHKFPGLGLNQVSSVRYHGMPAAEWEFTWLDQGQRVHVRDRQFRDRDGGSYAIYWQTSADRWPASLPTLRRVLGTFRVSAS